MKSLQLTWIGICLLAISSSLPAQNLVNDGASIVTTANTDLRLVGMGLINQGAGSVDNTGNIYLDLDWTQNGTATYTGSGWMWFEGNANQNLTGTAPISIPRLRVDNGNILDLGRDVEVSTELDLTSNGNVRLGTHNLSLSPGATIVNYDPTHYIITDNTGRLQQTVPNAVTMFPVGRSAYNPITLTNAGTVDVFGIYVEDQVLLYGTSGPVVSNNVVERTWHVDESALGGSNVSMGVMWLAGHEATAFDRNICGVTRWDGADWDNPGTYGPAGTIGAYFSQQRSNITDFSPFTVQDGTEPLPVEYLNFEARRLDPEQVALDWITGREENNRGFEVQRRLDTESDFRPVGWVDAKPDSAGQVKYIHLDPNGHTGLSYYRLRQIDLDGAFSLSETRIVAGTDFPASISIFPNPSSESVYVRFERYAAEGLKLRVFSMEGKLMFERLDFDVDNEILELEEMQELPAASYLFQLQLPDGQLLQERLIKLRP